MDETNKESAYSPAFFFPRKNKDCSCARQACTRTILFVRSVVVMAETRGFRGRGEYQDFSYPLPDVVKGLSSHRRSYRQAMRPSRPTKWKLFDGNDVRYPAEHSDLVYYQRCHDAGQAVGPLPCFCSFGAGDYNCLHQDLYVSAPSFQSCQGCTFIFSERRRFHRRRICESRNTSPRHANRGPGSSYRCARVMGVPFAVHHRPVQGNGGARIVSTSTRVAGRLGGPTPHHSACHLPRRAIAGGGMTLGCTIHSARQRA